MKFSPTEIWNISAEMLHTPKYREKYLEVLEDLIPSQDSLILDTACGTGFPSLDLYKDGYKMITCSDGDAESIEMTEEKFRALNTDSVNFHVSSWQELNKSVSGAFDVILNVDNSLVYLDSWSNTNNEISEDEIFENVKHVLKNFYSLLKPGGVCIVALAKNNDRDAENKIIPIGEGEYKGMDVRVEWKISYDWENRSKTWTNHTFVDGEEHIFSLDSYLITKEELMSLMEKVGFQDLSIIEKKGLYDNLIVREYGNSQTPT